MATTLSQASYQYEVILSKPDKTDAEATRRKTLNGFEIQKQHDDFVAYVLEGIKVEDESTVMRIIQWTSYEGHMRFRNGPIYSEFTRAREGAAIGPPDVNHYNFVGPLDIKSTPPVWEVIDITLKPDLAFKNFAADWDKPGKIVASAPGCKGYTIAQQREDDRKVLIFIAWESVEAHMQGFRGSEKWDLFVPDFVVVKSSYFVDSNMYHVKTVEPGTAAV